ncbi:histidine phosphatase superfamily [Ustulina deusta]|nr:histidine phosphatase superfamily [Ustulina deusta]
MPPAIHAIHHAQAQHNINNDLNHPDPVLTELGYQQCKTAATELGGLGDKIDLILASPLQRTIQTALAVFPAYTKSKKQVVLLPDLQESSIAPSDTGSCREYLEMLYGPVLDYSFLTPDWTDKGPKSRHSPRFAEARARSTRLFIRAIAQEYRDRDFNIVVVSHGMYLRYLTKHEGNMFRHVERRTYVFGPITGSDSEANFLETPCSIARRERWHAKPKDASINSFGPQAPVPAGLQVEAPAAPSGCSDDDCGAYYPAFCPETPEGGQ